MNAHDTDALQRAIENLGAVEVAPGRYAWQDKASAKWYSMDALGLDMLYRYVHDKEPKRPMTYYDLLFVPLPSWWTPERRFAVLGNGPRPGTHSDLRVAKACAAPYRFAVVTADLETGAEVSA